MAGPGQDIAARGTGLGDEPRRGEICGEGSVASVDRPPRAGAWHVLSDVVGTVQL